ncbi:MAG TPA: autotransporter-associated beta strand repeat-containing protein, partial [Rudaea sp.]|nr:autotransporter-associated beta strand repeat-containing protein [Rudaea sp.]
MRARSTYGILAAMVLQLAAHVAHAQSTYVWTGATSGDWNTPTNWTPNGVPGGTLAQGGNTEDIAEFDSSSRTTITFSASVELGAVSFAYGPAYTFQVDAFLQLHHGILNLSTTTKNTFIVGTGTLWLDQDGDAANSLITNNHDLDFAGTSSAGTATITNDASGTIYFANSATAAQAVIYNSGMIDNSYLTAPSSIGAIADGPASTLYLGSQTLSIGALNYTQTLEGTLLDGGFEGGTGGALTKVGSGFLQLTGNNTYTGKITVQEGLLEVDGALASPEVVVMPNATLAGVADLGTIVAQAGSFVAPGDFYNPSTSPPNTALTADALFCAPSPTLETRIGNVGSATKGDYLALNSALKSAFCPHVHFLMLSAGLPLTVGDYYLLILVQGTTDWTAGSADFDFNSFPGYTQA